MADATSSGVMEVSMRDFGIQRSSKSLDGLYSQMGIFTWAGSKTASIMAKVSTRRMMVLSTGVNM